MVAAQTIQSLAQELYEAFEGFKRDGSDATVYKLRASAPEWTTEVVAAAHGDMFPDDWRYEAIMSAAGSIADYDGDVEDADDYGHDWADGYVDVYTTNRLAWLASNLSRVEYVDDAAAEFGGGEGALDVVAAIGMGQYMEASEVYSLVLDALRSRLDETDES